jgi:hypothetical protein
MIGVDSDVVGVMLDSMERNSVPDNITVMPATQYDSCGQHFTNGYLLAAVRWQIEAQDGHECDEHGGQNDIHKKVQLTAYDTHVKVQCHIRFFSQSAADSRPAAVAEDGPQILRQTPPEMVEGTNVGLNIEARA